MSKLNILFLFLLIFIFVITKSSNSMEDKYCINKYTYEISIACQKDSTFISKELFNRMDYFWKSTSNESINEKNKAIYHPLQATRCSVCQLRKSN